MYLNMLAHVDNPMTWMMEHHSMSCGYQHGCLLVWCSNDINDTPWCQWWNILWWSNIDPKGLYWTSEVCNIIRHQVGIMISWSPLLMSMMELPVMVNDTPKGCIMDITCSDIMTSTCWNTWVIPHVTQMMEHHLIVTCGYHSWCECDLNDGTSCDGQI